MAEDESRLIARVKISFAKDTVYGAVLLAVFSALGWSQSYVSIAHVASAVCLFVNILFDEETALDTHKDHPISAKFVSLYMLACAATIVADLGILLMTSCSVAECCPEGSKRPVFMWTDSSDLCGGDGSRRFDSQLVASVVIATVIIGLVVALIRVVSIFRLRAPGEQIAWWVPSIVFVAIQGFLLTWSGTGTVLRVIVAAALVFQLGALVIVGGARFKGVTQRTQKLAKLLPLLSIVLGLVAIVLVFMDEAGTKAIKVPFVSFQGLSIALAIWAAVSAARTMMRQAADAAAALPSGQAPHLYGYGKSVEATGLMKL